MADVTLTYKGATIAELNDSGSKTIRTAGKFCEADIGVEYVKPSGGGVVLVTGTLTFAARTQFNGFSLDVGIDCDFFALYATVSPLQSNGRTYCGMFHDFTATTALNTINCTSNSGGSAYSGSLNAGGNISKSGTVLNFTTTDNSNFQAGITYKWYAWGVTA